MTNSGKFNSGGGDRAPQTYLVGAGVASLAAAVFLIRDGDAIGRDITILEESDAIGGSLDGAGTAERGYVLRGGRMLESHYACTFELFASIPTLDASRTVTQETMAWNETLKTSSKSRLMIDEKRIVAPAFGLSERHILTIERLAIEPEALLGRSRIDEQFDAAFFDCDFWIMWRTTFAFQPWHSAVEFKRYLVRFAHMVEGFDRLKGILRTVYNQYDSFVRPLRKWLDERGVVFAMNTTVTDLGVFEAEGAKRVDKIMVQREGAGAEILVRPIDRVLVTLGSMTEASSLGAMDVAPAVRGKSDGGAWTLWETLAEGRPEFGHPGVFVDHVDQSKWVSFTVTMNDPGLLNIVRDLTGNVPGEGGLITFVKSGWLASIVIPHQPHFIGQPEGVSVLWGYGLNVDAPGDFVKKPMVACTGREILTEKTGLEDYAVFAGVLPEDKFKIVKTYQAGGHTVGMCGDGANDAPALRQAQIGIAVSTATDVAKSAAGIVLTEPGLGGIVFAVQQGRLIFQRVLTYTLNSITKKIVQVLFIAAGLVMTGHAVLTPLLMAVIMIVGDVLGMSLATDNVRPSAHPNRWRVGRLTAAGVFMGLGQLMFSVAILATGRFVMQWDQRTLQTLVFLTIVCGNEATTYNNRERLRIWSSAPSRWLIGATLIDTAFASGLALAGIAMAPLPAPAVAAVVMAAVAFAFVIDFAKVPAFKRLAFA